MVCVELATFSLEPAFSVGALSAAQMLAWTENTFYVLRVSVYQYLWMPSHSLFTHGGIWDEEEPHKMYLLDVRCLFAIRWRLNGAIKFTFYSVTVCRNNNGHRRPRYSEMIFSTPNNINTHSLLLSTRYPQKYFQLFAWHLAVKYTQPLVALKCHQCRYRVWRANGGILVSRQLYVKLVRWIDASIVFLAANINFLRCRSPMFSFAGGNIAIVNHSFEG